MAKLSAVFGTGYLVVIWGKDDAPSRDIAERNFRQKHVDGELANRVVDSRFVGWITGGRFESQFGDLIPLHFEKDYVERDSDEANRRMEEEAVKRESYWLNADDVFLVAMIQDNAGALEQGSLGEDDYKTGLVQRLSKPGNRFSVVFYRANSNYLESKGY